MLGKAALQRDAACSCTKMGPEMLPASNVRSKDGPINKISRLSLCLSSSLLFLQFLPAQAQQPAANKVSSDSESVGADKSAVSTKAGKFTHPYGYYLQPILEHIHANPDQKVKITAIVQSYRARIEPLQSEYKQRNQALLDKLAHGESSTTIMDDQMRVGRLYSDLNLYYCQMSLEVRKILSPDQIVLYEEFKRQQGWNSSNQQAKAN